MIFDTDIFIWAQRGNEKAAALMQKNQERYLSIQTYMELLQCAKNKTQHKLVKDFLSSFGFIVLPLTENIGHRASIYVEEYTLSSSIRSGDAIVAATAVESNMILSSSNAKHFKVIKDLKLKIFKPS
ncbi:type II toxin-antitoxin system VapC family toxin [Desulfobacula sp.]|uniref:type II toxin-antitoxin system VapC family toxin n=1 Tax=Desulfobacula sp. TaxID=2593537 RepID=UPI002625A716|nr:type II toxin-antitoxin system VapC family toxin [Desulfobacula sp.]